MPPVFFHIGFPKTATTTLQTVLMAHRSCAYLGKGLREAAEVTLSLRLVQAATYLDTRRFEAALPGLRDEIAAVAENARCLVISEEGFSFAEFMSMGDHWPRSAVTDHETVAERLHRLAPQAQVLMSLREQADFLDSFWRQKIKSRHDDASLAHWVERELERLSGRSMLHAIRYDEAFDAYARRFGEEAVRVSLYEAYRRDFGGYLDQVAATTGLDAAALRSDWGGLHANTHAVHRRNRETVMRLRALLPEGVRALVPRAVRNRVMDSLAEAPPDPTFPEPLRERVRAHFAEPNRALVKRTGLDLAGHGYAVAEAPRAAATA